jgi:aminoglycoside phosphotransferase (APT) family kinase protein
MLAALHAVAPAAVGLDEQGTALPDEVERWRRAFGTCALTPETARAEETCFTYLVDSLPAPSSPAVLHGDWRLGNMQCVGTDVTAVIDWEIWSIGDPRLDLAWLRLMSDPAHPNAAAPEAPMLDPADHLSVYETAASTKVSDMNWFDTLVRYKQASASALLVKNAERRGQVTEQVERMRAGIPRLLDAAMSTSSSAT